MPTCPHCGAQFLLGSAKSELELYIKKNQPRMGVVNLKRDINREFGVKRFADLPAEKYPEALEFAKQKVDELTAFWDANKVLRVAVPRFLESVHASSKLHGELSTALRDRYSDRFWADLTPEEALYIIKKNVGETNIWEYCFKSA